MPEARPSERRPIVPDPDSSLTRPRRPMAPQPRLWPLKFAVLLLLVMLVGVSWLGWQERERMNAQMQQISAEMSNVHARFDAEEGRGERFERLESRLSAVMDHAESLVARMASLEVDVQQVGERDGGVIKATITFYFFPATSDAPRWSWNWWAALRRPQAARRS